MLAASSAAAGFPGSLDPSFGCPTAGSCSGYVLTGVPPPSGVATGAAMQLQSDGKIVVGGSAGSGTGANFAVVRLNTNGTLDTTFNGSGASTVAVGSGDDHAN